MNQFVYLHIFLDDPVLTIRAVLRFFHFVGLAIGLGSATLLDFMLLRLLFEKKMTQESWELFSFAAGVVKLGLFLLWATGLGFIAHYAVFDPDKLANPKIWAKLAVVVVLTINGFVIHSAVLPRLQSQIGKALFEGMSILRRSMLMIAGAISVTSWYVPVIIGAFPQLNYIVPATTILLGYGILLAFATIVIPAAINLVVPSSRSSDRSTPSRRP